jgi:hypothetical protein
MIGTAVLGGMIGLRRFVLFLRFSAASADAVDLALLGVRSLEAHRRAAAPCRR